MSYQPQQPQQPQQPWGQPPQAPTPVPPASQFPSYAPVPPPAAYVAPVQAAPVQAATPPPGQRRTALALVGGLLLIGGLGAAAVLFLQAGSAEEDTVKGFARAPGGCITTMTFEHGGSFNVYLETKGVSEDLGGDCAASGSTYDHQGGQPDIDLKMDGATVELVAGGPSYDVGGFAGSQYAVVEIPAAGDYDLTVNSEATDIAVAVGGDPDDAGTKLTTAAIVAAAAGLLLGGGLLAAGMKRRRPGPQQPATPAWPSTGGGADWTQGYTPAAPVPGPAMPPASVNQPSAAPPGPTWPTQTAPAPQPQQPPAAPPAPGWGAPHQ